MITGVVTTDLRGIVRFEDVMRTGGVHLEAAVKKWAFRYRAFLQDRFERFSEGGGDWPALQYREGSILRKTGTLFAALSPLASGAPGQLEEVGHLSVSVGYGGSAIHPDGGDATIAQIAAWHDEGAGFLPVREIIVYPPQELIATFIEDMNTGIQRTIDDTALGS